MSRTTYAVIVFLGKRDNNPCKPHILIIKAVATDALRNQKPETATWMQAHVYSLQRLKEVIS